MATEWLHVKLTNTVFVTQWNEMFKKKPFHANVSLGNPLVAAPAGVAGVCEYLESVL